MYVPRQFHPSLLHAMWKATVSTRFGYSTAASVPTLPDCLAALDESPFIDYFYHRAIKMDFAGEDLDFTRFNVLSRISGEDLAMELMTRPGFGPQIMVL